MIRNCRLFFFKWITIGLQCQATLLASHLLLNGLVHFVWTRSGESALFKLRQNWKAEDIAFRERLVDVFRYII